MRTAESSVKRRGSPSSLASEEPSPKRTEACADSSLVTQLFNDKFIEGLACVLAVDENVVGMAEKLLEGAKSEHGTLDLDAWINFTSLPIWQNDKLMQYPTKMGPKQEHLYQQIQETKACFSDDPSLKQLIAEKEHIRVVLILVILFWSRDVSPTRAKESLGRDLGDGTDSWANKDFEDFGDFEEEPWACCAFDKSFDFDDLFMTVPSNDEEKLMENLTDEVMKDHEIDHLLPELLGTVDSDTPQGALEHFDKVKEVWGNRKFVDHLLKFDQYRTRDQARNVSDVRLSIKIRSLIKKDTLFEMISEYDDPGFRMRVALSILIGFWSNQGMIRPLVCTMGGALGVKKVQSGEGKEESPCDWMSDNTPNIMEFYRDKSIRELADKLKEEPIAVELVEVYLKTLKLDDCYCSYDEHFQRASCFWFHPSIILKFKKAMNKDPELVKVLTKYSKGAETLRRQERMVHIRKDFQPELRAIDSNDSRSKTRLALNILFGYWVDQDVTQLYLSLRCLKKRIGKVFDDLSKEAEIAAFYYYASSATDVEGLKSWLANKYGEGSKKALSLAEQIGNYQEAKGKEAEERGYSGGPLCIQLVLNESSILTFSLCWFGSSNDTSDFKELLGIHIPLLQ